MSRRENHDASGFYGRFTAPLIDRSSEIHGPFVVEEPFRNHDIRSDPNPLPDASVALVVTSPPYFVGKQYEEELDREGVPTTYAEYIDMLRGVLEECYRVLEPGGRMAINVANLGRKPYRSLSADVITILQDDLRMLMRGEVIWQKGEGAAGSCAWGSFRSAANPVLRDLTERVLIASKGRFDRAIPVKDRERHEPPLPHRNTLNTDEFMEATLDVWKIQPEQAKRVGHPAPFPIELPERLIHLYTYEDDLVLDPFMGSGTSLAAAAKWRRRYVGYDLDPEYVAIARGRVEAVVAERPLGEMVSPKTGTAVPSAPAPSVEDDFQARASKEGLAAQQYAAELLEAAGFEIAKRNTRLRGLGVVVNIIARDASGTPWYFDVSGAYTTTRGGLLRTDTVWKALGRAHVVASNRHSAKELAGVPYVLMSSHLPRPGSEGDVALRAVGQSSVFDVIEMESREDFNRLRHYAAGGFSADGLPLLGFWREKDLRRTS
ncbi:MAG: DNA-methyltransferase [Acidimicrobiia bacterium]